MHNTIFILTYPFSNTAHSTRFSGTLFLLSILFFFFALNCGLFFPVRRLFKSPVHVEPKNGEKLVPPSAPPRELRSRSTPSTSSVSWFAFESTRTGPPSLSERIPRDPRTIPNNLITLLEHERGRKMSLTNTNGGNRSLAPCKRPKDITCTLLKFSNRIRNERARDFKPEPNRSEVAHKLIEGDRGANGRVHSVNRNAKRRHSLLRVRTKHAVRRRRRRRWQRRNEGTRSCGASNENMMGTVGAWFDHNNQLLWLFYGHCICIHLNKPYPWGLV